MLNEATRSAWTSGSGINLSDLIVACVATGFVQFQSDGGLDRPFDDNRKHAHGLRLWSTSAQREDSAFDFIGTIRLRRIFSRDFDCSDRNEGPIHPNRDIEYLEANIVDRYYAHTKWIPFE